MVDFSKVEEASLERRKENNLQEEREKTEERDR